MRILKKNTFLLALLFTVGCSTTRVDEEVNTAFTISDDESIVLLSNSYHAGNQTELDFMDCLNSSIAKKQNTFEIIPTKQFQNLFYPWFEPSTAPQSIEDLPKILNNDLVKSKLTDMRIKYLIKITGETKTNASSGALSCAAGPGGGGCFGFAWWDDTSAYNASVWDLSQETSVGNVSANVTGTSMIPAIVIPIPILARTQLNACDGLSDQIVGFFSS
ncbi:MAG: hypothetical protein QF513_05140 [Gammaproteobacteria bacterium]|jgi:hypothetical protein|nr:hypothetical protein [Gammaproteobacteria bacterium]MBQ08184.1 hypothetical protein [Gammaproteobacteria bacterium]MDP6147164.1 hypothetical protein [Gammaproteobacteria bacterium]HJL80424.1 hypothetical protein [Gammaproteobacteria bacterium]HJM08940.1 hypothetical protein [Gammaproteobacteria bacterium]|tara:strand:- start:3320 stop:3973 length:654 start_codon:yes stop_codon:yes gene_type:complete